MVRRIDGCPDPNQPPASIPEAASSGDVWEDTAAVPDAPILVHHCNDEKTLSVAERHMARDKGDNLSVQKLSNSKRHFLALSL